MKRFQGFLIGVFVTLLVIQGIPNFADSLSVVLNSINIKVNGNEIARINEDLLLSNGTRIPYSINYNGNTYLPMKKLAELLNKNVTWDAATKTAIVSDLGSTNNTVSVKTENSRSNPAKLNENIVYQTANYDKKDFTLNITMTEMIRGYEAFSIIQAANMFNEPPADDEEVILAKFKVEVVNATDIDKQYTASYYSFDLVSSQGKDYEHYSVVMPEPDFSAQLFQGASNEGWVAFKVKKDDLKPLIVFEKNYDGTGGKWFYAYN